MDYQVQFWFTPSKKDIVVLSKLQQRATNIIRKLEHNPYETRLKCFRLCNLEKKITKGRYG